MQSFFFGFAFDGSCEFRSIKCPMFEMAFDQYFVVERQPLSFYANPPTADCILSHATHITIQWILVSLCGGWMPHTSIIRFSELSWPNELYKLSFLI